MGSSFHFLTSYKMSKYVRNDAGHFVCPHCSVVKEKQNTMYYHIKKNHEKDFPFECTHCDTHPKFLQKSAYLHHLATMHADIPDPEGEKNPYAGIEFSCPSDGCEHTTHTKANMMIHYIRNHCKDWIPSFAKGAACTCCKGEFGSSSAYYYHAAQCFKGTAPAAHTEKLSLIK